MISLLLHIILSTLFYPVYSDAAVCETKRSLFGDIIRNKKAVDVFYFTNDTKKNIQLTWAEENSGVILLVTMTEGDSGPVLTSDIYRSENNGKYFTKIKDILGEKVYIRREHGLQRQQNQKELFLICYDINDKSRSVIFVTKDGGITWSKSGVPFVLSGQLIFHPRQKLPSLILTLEEKTHRLYLSPDSGKTWTKVHENVVDFFWSIYESDTEQTFYVLHNPGILKNDTTNQTLVKTTDLGLTWIHIMHHVVRVWAPRGISTQTRNLTFDSSMNTMTDRKMSDRFMYVSHVMDTDNLTQQLSVSLDGGKSFNPVYLPLIQSERFYSVLEVEDDMAFVHVDAPNDTGYGTLFTSDSSGQILTESLKHHLYPNHAPVTDFYRVASMRGTYLTTRMNPNRTLYSVISHDRGASWRPLGVPLNVDGACKTDTVSSASSKTEATSDPDATNVPPRNHSALNESDSWDDWSLADYPASQICGLQISSQFSIRNRVIASAPLSIAAAPGLILAHGHVATHLKNTPADVFVSTDGGYTWNKALDGPHHCQIANRGGLLVAVPADTLWPDVLRFSTDEGRCWHTIPLRSGVYHADTGEESKKTTVTVHEHNTTVASVDASLVPRSSFDTSTTTPVAHNKTSTEEPSSIPDPWDEPVVFAGLVTEPGGRAMAAAVYGYGTLSQHWRVAIVDFVTNGMVTRNCTAEDYEIWVPHSSTEGSTDGCLLGVRQHFKRLKKNSVCINAYGMDPLSHTEPCACTQADFECEYGFHRKLGTLECVRNPNVPLLDWCLLSEGERRFASQQHQQPRPYRRIPGDQCVGGWQPPSGNQTDFEQASLCSDKIQSTSEHHSTGSGSAILVSLIFTLLLLLLVGLFCYRHSRRYPQSLFGVPMVHSASYRLQSVVCPWKFKELRESRSRTNASGLESSWPPVTSTNHWQFRQMNANGGSILAGPRDLRPSLRPCSASHQVDCSSSRSHTRPLFGGHFRRSSELDVTGLIEAEEVALPSDLCDPSEESPSFGYPDHPLAAPFTQKHV